MLYIHGKETSSPSHVIFIHKFLLSLNKTFPSDYEWTDGDEF